MGHSRIHQLKHRIRIVSLLGAPGSGKERKGKILARIFPFHRLVTSDLIRGGLTPAHGNPTPHDLRGAGDVQSAGDLVDDTPVIRLFENAVLRIPTGETKPTLILIDGFPRTWEQAGWLLNCGVPFSLILLEIDKQTCLDRIAERAAQFGPRPDDAKAPHRFDVFEKETLRAVRRISKHDRSLVQRVDGTAPIREQMVKMVRHIDSRHLVGDDFQQLVANLDTPSHPAHQEMVALESPRKRLPEQQLPTPFYPVQLSRYENAEQHVAVSA